MNKLRYVMRDFTAYVFSSRLLLFILMQLVIMHFYVKNILSFSEAVNYPVSIWIFPFLFQHVYIQFIYGISSVYFFSTVPFFNTASCIPWYDRDEQGGCLVNVYAFYWRQFF